jgi:hypothetical protein
MLYQLVNNTFNLKIFDSFTICNKYKFIYLFNNNISKWFSFEICNVQTQKYYMESNSI